MAAEKQTSEPQKLSKYEKARIIGSRALQISMGAPFLVKLEKEGLEKIRYNPIEIAKLELEANVIPISVVREVPKKK
ncbi:DNA-directed RNA polymerase subunit K [Candidatus Woesearchaeota archaeon]|nr:DNA-directed RNA polymerase subunit K [Candidatus Woesearchaeota archaeon]